MLLADGPPAEGKLVDSVLAKDIDGLEARLTREGYNTKVLAETERGPMGGEFLSVAAGERAKGQQSWIVCENLRP